MEQARVLSAQQLAAVKLFGSRDVVKFGQRLEEPAHGVRAVRAMLMVGYQQDDAAMMRVFNEAGLNGPGVALFVRNKIVARLPYADGGGIQVQPLIPGVADDNLSEYAGSTDEEEGGQERPPVPVVDDRQLIYKLNAIFTDVTVSDKLQLSPRRLQMAKRLAVSDPAAAAASLGDYLRSNGFPQVKVVAGDYAKTAGRARQLIHEFGDTIVYKDNEAPAVATPNNLRVTYDGLVTGGAPIWTVTGPLKYATEVLIIYQLAIHYGPERVMFILGSETAMLRINIYEEATGDYYTGIMHGYSSLMGIQPVSSALPSELTADQQTRLVAAAGKISPVYVDDMVVGSAVHVSDKHVILNEHTLTSAIDAERVPMVAGMPVYESNSVAHDITMIKRSGVNAQWVFRQSDVGERVVLCYSVGSSVEFSEVLRVTGVHGEQLVLSESNILRRGASGAAVIALRDSALLGIFSTSRGHNVICAAFTSSTFSIVTDYASVASSEVVATPSEAAGDRTYGRMVKRGLLGFLTQIAAASASLYVANSGTQVMAGLVANVSGTWHTTVDPDAAQLYMADGKPLTFRTDMNDTYSVVAPPPVLTTLPNVRVANPGERVFLFTKSGDDVVMSSVRIVTHCMSDMRRFQVEDFGESVENMIGALVVAEKDAAVVGQYVRCEHDAYGVPVVRCASLTSSISLVVPEITTVHDARSIVGELQQFSARSDATVNELATFGDLIVDVIGGQRGFVNGLSIRDGTAIIAGEWRTKRQRVLAAFGWLPDDWGAFIGLDSNLVASAFMALTYLHDPIDVSRRLGMLLSEDTIIDKTPVVGEFPFPRPSSAASSGLSGRTDGGGRNVLNIDEAGERLKELENRFEQLAQYVRSHPRVEDPDVLAPTE